MAPRSVASVALPSLVLALASALGCSRSGRKVQPSATLATSRASASELGALREAWASRSLSRSALEQFLSRYPSDGAAPLVKVYLAFERFAGGELDAADAVLDSLRALPAGPTRDLATVARARSLRLHGRAESALEELRPLVGKFVDDADREVFLEEIALCATAAHDDYEALAYLDAWLRGVSEEDQGRAKKKIVQILDTLPRAALEQTYGAMRSRGSTSGYGADTEKLVAERLARIAVQSNDAVLARWLVEQSGTSAAEVGGDAALELGDLATSRRGIETVTGRTVGLLLPTRSREQRDEAADVVRGVSWALDLPKSAGREGGVRLVTREDGEDVAGTRAAMEELAGEGATVIIGGFDRPSANRAIAWSERSGLSVMALAAPSPSKLPKSSAVVLGESVDRELAMLSDALVRHGVSTAAVVIDATDDEAAVSALEGEGRRALLLPSVRCDMPLAKAGATRFPIRAWWHDGARGVLVSGPSACARDVARDLAASATGAGAPALALTLESGIAVEDTPRGVTVLSASAGIVPILAANAASARDEEVRDFMERFGVRPSYWTALGHDAGVLAKAALAPLPGDTTTDPRAVAQRRAVVQAGLLATRAKLWTTDEQSIGVGRVLPRSLRLVTWQRDKK